MSWRRHREAHLLYDCSCNLYILYNFMILFFPNILFLRGLDTSSVRNGKDLNYRVIGFVSFQLHISKVLSTSNS
jgi:hypothetical protein